MFPNFTGNFFVAQIRFGAQAGAAKRRRHLLGIVALFLGNIQYHDLHRRQPQRHGASIVFDENTDETLERTEDRPVQHDGNVAVISRIDEQGGKVFVEGELWNAVSAAPVDVGGLAQITEVNGLTVKVKPEKA